MEKTKLLFLAETTENTLEVFYHPKEDVITFWISRGEQVVGIDLNKSTAIKLVKTLKSEINKIKEVNNV
jgi:hypothetical protein